MVKQNGLAILTFSASVCALLVIALGAFTRLMDAGLGCPDWPGCYGHWVVDAQTVPTSLMMFKAWAEMIHRYAVAVLSVLIVSIVSLIFLCKRYRIRYHVIFSLLLVILLCYQILLGQWTVTLKLLPTIVTQHLLGAFLILATLWCLYLKQRVYSPLVIRHSTLLFTGALIAIVVVFVQLFLGAWTSTHYAALSCSDFPFCNNATPWLTWDLRSAFDFLTPIGVNYEGGVLAESVRQTIHMVHRFGAGIVVVYVGGFLAYVAMQLKTLQPMIAILLGLLMMQIGLGIANVIFQLPVITAVSHTLVAALLWLGLITLAFRIKVSS